MLGHLVYRRDPYGGWVQTRSVARLAWIARTAKALIRRR